MHGFTHMEGKTTILVFKFKTASGREICFPAYKQPCGTTIVDVRSYPTYGPMVLVFDADRLRKMGLAEDYIESASTSEPQGFLGFKNDGHRQMPDAGGGG